VADSGRYGLQFIMQGIARLPKIILDLHIHPYPCAIAYNSAYPQGHALKKRYLPRPAW